MATLIEMRGLTKHYDGHRGIVDLTCTVDEAEVFGFLGPNGAGKTTTMRLLMGLLRPTAGSAAIAGLDCWDRSTEVKRLVGYLPGEFTCDPSLTGGQILQFLANLRGGVDQAYLGRLVERLELDPSKRFRAYSHGNKQKVGLIQAFMHRPRLLILDEPTNGLDPLNQEEFHGLVAEVRAEGRTVFLSSHILWEIEHTCDRVGIIREGRLVSVDRVAHMKQVKQHLVEIAFAERAAPEWFASLPGVVSVTAARDSADLDLVVEGPLREVLKVAAAHDAITLSTREPSLEEIFLRLYEPKRVAQPATAGTS